MAFPDPVTRRLDIGGVAIGGGAPLALICGPCVIESPEHTLMIAERVAAIARPLGLPLIFKASFDKANRSSVRSYRGPGMEAGLAVLAEVKRRTGLPVLTDIHERQQAEAVAAVVDMIQIPAFLARQTDLLLAAAATGRPINVKKGQFMAPEDMRLVVGKLEEGGCEAILLTERGASFGYHRLVSDFRALPVMRATGWPVCFDATHSVQLPSGAGEASGGQAEMIPYLARAATAVGIDALFVETHDDPARALSDGPNALALDQLEPLLRQVLAIQSALRTQ